MTTSKSFKNIFYTLIILTTSTYAADSNQQLLDKVINGNQRTASFAVRDGFRHPAAVLDFFAVKADSSVVEIWPGGSGWYTEILAPYLKQSGKFYAAGYDPELKSPYYQNNLKAFTKKLAQDPASYDAVKVTVFNPEKSLEIAPAGSVSHVLTFRNVHNWKGRGDKAVANAFVIFYKALKPGGVLGLVEHRMPESFHPKADDRSGYVKQSYIIEMANNAGFVLDAQSEINANPKDNANHPKGVWTLPPNYRLKQQDHAKYEAIGESDRMTLRFIKPKK